MARISGAVYDPPREGLPTLAVVFGVDGHVLVARCTDSRQEAEAILAQIQKTIQDTIDKEAGRDS